MSDKKVVFFDIDGTLYEFDKGIPDSAVEGLKRLKENGHIIILCTGRPVSSLFPEILCLPHDGVISGAGTRVEFGDKVLRNELLSNELLMQTVPRMEKNGCTAVLEGPEYLSCRMDGDAFDYFRILLRLRDDYPERLKEMELMTDRTCKITVAIKDMEAFERMIPELSRAFELARYEDGPYTEMMPKNISKADGIRILLEELEIPLKNTYAFGDGPNDMEMLQYVEYGTAMGNAETQVLETAKYRTEGMWEDGIYHALQRYGLI